jgi:hypothetical protein
MDDGVNIQTTEPQSLEHKRPVPQADRIAMSSLSAERLKTWIEQVQGQVAGIRVTKTDLVNWLIENHDAELSGQEVRALEISFFDEIKFAEWALRELKARRAQGESVSIQTLMKRRKSANQVRKGRRKDASDTAVNPDK